MQRCTICRGTKKIMGMGGMSKPCEPCKGIGYVEAPKTINRGNTIDSIPQTVTLEIKTPISEPKPAKVDGRKLYWEKKRAEKLAQLTN